MNIVETAKRVAESVSKGMPQSATGVITNVDNADYTIDVDLDLPLGEVVVSNRAIVTPYAGDGFGFICSPREGGTVVTAPLDGEYDKAVVLGRVFNTDTESIPSHELGDVILRHELGNQWSFTYSQPVTGNFNLDTANIVNLEIVDEESTANGLTYRISSNSFDILPDQLIRVVLKYEADDDTTKYLDVYVEWEDRVKYDETGSPYIQISDDKTVVGGPLYQSDSGQTPKNYLTSQYQDKYYAMVLSPPKGRAQFSHYMGMGLFMEEYPSRIPIGSGMREDGRLLVDENGNPYSWSWNTDSFLNDTMDEEGYLNNFPRGAMLLSHYSGSGLVIQEKIRKTYDLDDNDDWSQSANEVGLSLFRTIPNVKTVKGLDDPEAPMASFIMEDDCKNSVHSSVHVRVAHDITSVQGISLEDIDSYNVQHFVEGDTPLEHDLPGTRPSRLQFYDLKQTPQESDADDFICIHDKDGHCALNEDAEGNELDDTFRHEATYGSGVEDPKLKKKKCPNWPGCTEGHYTHPDVDIPLAVRNSDIRINNKELLMKPKANAEFVHYTNSGLFFEEQLPIDDSTGEFDYAKAPLYHAPAVVLRMREWDYLPKSDGTTVVNYKGGEKNNAHEPKRYDLTHLKFETIYGDRSGDGGNGNYEEADNGNVTFTDEHESYKTATKVTLAQTVYGNKIADDPDTPLENQRIQLGNRLVFEDLLEGDAPSQTIPADIWEPSDNSKDPAIEGDDADTRLILPKSKLELRHFTDSGLVIEETALDATHMPAMSMYFNYWDYTNYRPMMPRIDELDPIGVVRWEETADSADPTASLVDYYLYHNTYRDQHVTLEEPTAWWDGSDGGTGRTGAYLAIRESDNAEQGKPVVELTDSVNSVKMDSGDDKKVEITNRDTQFTEDKANINKITMDAINQLLEIWNGTEGSGDNKIILDKANKTITIEDANGNVITTGEKGLDLTDANGNNVKTDDKGVILTDSVNGNEMKMSDTGVTINGHYLVTQEYVEWMFDNQAQIALGNYGAPAPIHPAALPDFTAGVQTPDTFLTDK